MVIFKWNLQITDIIPIVNYVWALPFLESTPTSKHDKREDEYPTISP